MRNKPTDIRRYKVWQFRRDVMNAAAAKKVGSTFRTLRESKGISLSHASSMSRLDSLHLERIEDGEFDKLPQGPYVKGYLRAYAEALGTSIDVEATLTQIFPPSSPTNLRVHSSLSRVQMVVENPSAPEFAEYLLYLFLTPSERVYLLGDLEEEYLEVYCKFGQRRANVWFYKQAFATLLPLIGRSLRRIKAICLLIETIIRLKNLF